MKYTPTVNTIIAPMMIRTITVKQEARITVNWSSAAVPENK